MSTNLLDRARYWECTNAEYHANDTHDSHSSLDLFMHSIEQYAARRMFRTARSPAAHPRHDLWQPLPHHRAGSGVS